MEGPNLKKIPAAKSTSKSRRQIMGKFGKDLFSIAGACRALLFGEAKRGNGTADYADQTDGTDRWKTEIGNVETLD